MSQTTRDQKFTGWQRASRTRFGVRFAEVASRLLITLGGIGTVAAVTLIFVFLFSVVVPLFFDAEVETAGTIDAAVAERGLHLEVDEYRNSVATIDATGRALVRRTDDGSLVREIRLFEGEPPTAAAFSIARDQAVFGFADGSLRLARLAFEVEFVEEENVPPSVRGIEPGELREEGGELWELTPEGKYRAQRFRATVAEPIESGLDAEVALVDAVFTDTSSAVVAMSPDGRLRLSTVREVPNWATGESTFTSKAFDLPYEGLEGKGPPEHVLIGGLGDMLYLGWPDGYVVRLLIRDPTDPRQVEVVSTLQDPDARVTAMGFLLGRATFVVGDSTGRIGAWFVTRPDDAQSVDGADLREGHAFSAVASPVLAFAASPRSRLLAAGHEDGTVAVFHVTGESLLVRTSVEGAPPIEALALAPKEDGLVAVAGGNVVSWDLEPRYPNATLATLFGPVWYEGYPEPDHVWQSSSGTDDFEPKLGLRPLIFGTIKATFYSMIFGTPLAILAAIFTSEFLSKRLRTPIKSSIEMMASLPSVVLGFIAALVIAPFVQAVLPGVLALFVTVPGGILFGAYLWQLLPSELTIRFQGVPRLFVILVAIALGVGAASYAGPLVESWLFAGDIEVWLDGQVGSAVGGWMFLTLPAAALAVTVLVALGVNPWLRWSFPGWSRARWAGAGLLKFVAGSLVAAALAFGVAIALSAAGFDPRGSFLGTYVQRNALVVGFVMGFAIIPIIYTLAEDALTSVPDHLRQASLGAGATTWQTAVRVVVPTAMSGLFSAVMIGLGRAVGETMIVLMATGNTPVRDWNVFNGFRTLSANIAVELPEAVKDSTHYRTLFLAALVLFAMTFLLNTVAEVVRQRFRKRAYQI